MAHSSFAANMAWSTLIFQEQVWPIIKTALGGGELIQMEGRPDIDLARRLDELSGIDAWQTSKLGMRGIASRVLIDKGFRTFTIRKSLYSGSETEFSKRCRAIDSKGVWLYPSITVQAYATTKAGPVPAVGIAYTEDIIRCIRQGDCVVRDNTDADFYAIPWETMQAGEYKIKVITPPVAA